VDEPDQLPSGWVHLALFKGDGVLLGGAALTVCSRSCAAAAVDRVMMVNVSNGRRTDPRPGEVEA
jgi:hypothetical protein